MEFWCNWQWKKILILGNYEKLILLLWSFLFITLNIETNKDQILKIILYYKFKAWNSIYYKKVYLNKLMIELYTEYNIYVR